MNSKKSKEVRHLAKLIMQHNSALNGVLTEEQVYKNLKRNYKEAKKNGVT